ncbi:hypothetical protein ACERIT_11390 [Halopenitus sp. H-Gu1]|uniref:hypothetical protein n=1 Tax=Halopenitus sp. H-Gu1 TaxID=3242697 RepID=UPI00359EA4E5
MSYPVTYHCPRCGTLVSIERDGYLADKSVTPYPFEGWTYAEPTAEFDADQTADGDDAATSIDGVRFVCGESAGVTWNPSPKNSVSAEEAPATLGDGRIETNDAGDETNDVISEMNDASSGTENANDEQPVDVGCGEPFYLSFVRFEDGREVDPNAESSGERVRLDLGRGPSAPRGPPGPNGPDAGGFWS